MQVFSVHGGNDLPRVSGTGQGEKEKGSILHRSLRDTGHLTKTLQVPIVPISVKAPVVASMLYMETLFEPEFAT